MNGGLMKETYPAGFRVLLWTLVRRTGRLQFILLVAGFGRL
jgi:hypothetical protein